MRDVTVVIGNDVELVEIFGPLLPAYAPASSSGLCILSSFLPCLKDPKRDLLECELAAGEGPGGERLADLHGDVWKMLKHVHPLVPEYSFLKLVNKTINGMLLEVYHNVLLCLRSLVEHFVQYMLELIRRKTSCIEQQTAILKRNRVCCSIQLVFLRLVNFLSGSPTVCQQKLQVHHAS